MSNNFWNRWKPNDSKFSSIYRGQHYEQAAAKFLNKQGLTLIANNQRYKNGEIDLVMQDNNTLVFIEVRFRENNHYGGAAASVTRAKQRRCIHAAQHFLQQHKQYKHLCCRFDVMAISTQPDSDILNFNWIKSAFS